MPNLFTAVGFGRGEFSVTEREAYDLLNLRVAVQSIDWSVAAWGNITDAEYLGEVISAPEFGGSFVHAAPGAAYGAEVEYPF